MHHSAHAHMQLCVETYMPRDRRYRVVDLGSRSVRKQKLTHRQLLSEHDCEIVGVDIRDGRNVDVVMEKPYRIPLPSNNADILMSGQVFEHVPFFWATMLEIARILKPGGHAFVTAPSRGHVHDSHDCWRYYPDGMRAMAAFARLELREAHTDFPPANSEGRHDHAAISGSGSYWGDSVGVFRKPLRYPRIAIWPVRTAVLWWANRNGDLGSVPRPERLASRERVLSSGRS